MRLTVLFSDKPSCYVGLHSSDSFKLFEATASRHFCRALRLERSELSGADRAAGAGSRCHFVGWAGDVSLAPGAVEVSRPFAAILGLVEGEIVTLAAVPDAPVAAQVMVQPHSVDDWEVVEIHANFIEEHLLAQIAVLTPGQVFPVWIHGHTQVRLRVDARDDNKGDCFMLGRDSELAIESKQRKRTAKSVFGAKELTSGPGLDGVLQLRIFSLSQELEVPAGRIHPEDLETLSGYRSTGNCLAWLSAQPQGEKGPEAAVEPGQVLVKLEPNASVPRRHLVIAACVAARSQITGFSLVRVWRCRQVPVYVPHLELVPLRPSRVRGAGEREEDAGRVVKLFEALVRRVGETELMDGAVVQLRPEVDVPVPEVATKLIGKTPWEAEAAVGSAENSAEVRKDDLYAGLEDIDDIYGSSSTPTQVVQVASGGLGVYELDLGLDEEPDWDPSATATVAGASQQGAELPEIIAAAPTLVRVRFALGVARAELSNTQAPPFVRLTARSLSSGVRITVAAEPGSAGVGSVPEGLVALWTSTPGLAKMPEDSWADVVQLVPCTDQPAPLDGLKLFSEPAEKLFQNILAQLGCYSEPPAKDTEPVPAWPTEPTVACSAARGSCAVIGGSGTGKTTLCRRVCAGLGEVGVLSLEVTCAKLGQPTRKFKAVKEWLQAIFRFACWHSPCVLLLDDLAALCPDVEAGAPNPSVTEERSVVLAELLLDLLLQVRSSGSRVAVVATLPDDAAAHRVLWRSLALEHKVQLRAPQLKERPKILQMLCREQSARTGMLIDADILAEGALDEWGSQVDGFSVADLAALLDRACTEASVEASAAKLQGGSDSRWSDPKRLELRHLEIARGNYVPTTMADQTFFTSTVRWPDIGGLARPKQILLDMLTMPTKYAVLVDRAPVRPRRGCMLVGPPGCGKTMLVHAAANETKGLLRFLTVKGPELLSKYIGASEAGVRGVFERAAAAAPAVIFFDEIEALAPKRGGDSTGVTDRVVNQMLTYLDGVEDRGRVYVVAATSRPDMVDGALMRPGRFDKICLCDLPSSEEKLQICEVLAAKHSLTVDAEDLRQLVTKFPPLFTSADINALFSSATIEAVNESVNRAQAEGGTMSKPELSFAMLDTALQSAKASISEADMQRYEKIFAPYKPGVKASAMSRDIPEAPKSQRVALA